ncbi:MAG: NAD(P)/FAD-dependent oxidoreductase [Daejeonella sp.]
MGQAFSYWEQHSFLSGFDVIIIGSGIVGLSAALHLKAKTPLLKIAILEAGFLPSGASTKNAGFACFGSLSEAISEIRSGGESTFLELVGMRWAGLSKLRKNLGDDVISFQRNGGYEIFKEGEDKLALEYIEQIEYVNKLLNPIIGKPDIYAVANAKIAGFGFAGITNLIENKYEGQIDTGKMMQALIVKAQGSGVQIFNNCRVDKIDPDKSGHIVYCDKMHFNTRSLIIATNAFTRDLIPELQVWPGRGQVLVTEPLDNLKVCGSFHYNKGYTYFRNIHNRILLGGFRDLDPATEQTLEPGLTDLVQAALEEMLRGFILPGKKPKIDYRWSGVMGFGPELKPIVKELRPNLYCAVRCNGMGIAMGSLLGEQVAELVEPF